MGTKTELSIRRTALDLTEDVRLDISPQLLEEGYFNEIDQFDDIINDITATCAQVSEQCAEICAEIAVIGSQVGELVADSGLIKSKGKAALAGMAIELAAGLGSELYGAYKQHKIDEERNRQMYEILMLKQEIAREKLEWCEEQLKIFTDKTKYVALFKKEFEGSIVLGERFTDKKVAGFKRTFAPYIKWQYNMEILKYLIVEMQAWLHGDQTSNLDRPDWTLVVDKELSRWPKMIFPKSTVQGWENALNSVLYQEQRELPIPIYLMLTEPFFLRNYVGVGVGELVHCCNHQPLICLPQEKPLSRTAQLLLSKNSYYNDMLRVAQMVPEEAPISGGVKDVLVISVVALIVMGVFLYIDSHMDGFWFFVVGSIVAWLGGASIVLVSRAVPSADKCEEYAGKLEELINLEKESASKNNEIIIK